MMFSYSQTLPNPEATMALAQKLAPFLMPGDVVALTGFLGAGKSHFVRSLIGALGTQQTHLPSPTFTLMQTYDDTRLPVAHADFYRLGDPSEADELNLDPFIEHGLTFIEWADNAPHVCPERTLWVHFDDVATNEAEASTEQRGTEEIREERVATFTNTDACWRKRFGFFVKDLQRAVTDKGRHNFVEQAVGKKGGVITPVSADASFRSYWRVRHGDMTRILMDAPPPMEDLSRFVQTAQYLNNIGIHAPHIYEADTENGYALLEDFGNTTVFDAIQSGQSGADGLVFYEAAVDILVHIAHSEPSHVSRQRHAEWLDETCLFTDWFMPYATGHATHTADRRYFRRCIADFMAAMPSVPKTTMHKDYHCQNLMVLDQERSGASADLTAGPTSGLTLGVLDFQDSRLGPISYDLASLLYDVRFDVPSHYHQALIERFVAKYNQHESAEPLDTAALEKAVKMIALMNLLRIAGVFTRLCHRDGKAEYLAHMPLLWSHVDTLLADLPEADALKQFLDKHTPVKNKMAV